MTQWHFGARVAIGVAACACLLELGCSGVGAGVRLDTSMDPSTYGALIYVNGTVDEGMQDAIARTVSAVPTRRIMLQLNSTGGSVQAGFAIVNYLAQLKRDIMTEMANSRASHVRGGAGGG